MNIVGNTRWSSTEEVIEKAVFNLIKHRNYDGFTIKDICAEAGINRSTFYAHYTDINDLMIKIEGGLAKKMRDIWKTDIYGQALFIQFFTFIKEYKEFYKAFLRSHSPSFVAPDMLKRQKEQFRQISANKGFRYSDAEIDYHLNYFGGGLKAICGRWIENNCRETPEQMAKIIHDEYANNSKYFN